jgi:hypothetical protein
MARRRKRAELGGLGLLIAIAGFYAIAVVALDIIRSSLGVVIAGASIIAAMLYGLRTARLQAASDRRWRDLSRLRSLTGTDFENHVADAYRKQGYHVRLTKASGNREPTSSPPRTPSVSPSSASSGVGRLETMPCSKYSLARGTTTVTRLW